MWWEAGSRRRTTASHSRNGTGSDRADPAVSPSGVAQQALVPGRARILARRREVAAPTKVVRHHKELLGRPADRLRGVCEYVQRRDEVDHRKEIPRDVPFLAVVRHQREFENARERDAGHLGVLDTRRSRYEGVDEGLSLERTRVEIAGLAKRLGQRQLFVPQSVGVG